MKIAFVIPPDLELLDLAGPVQVFTEAKFYGFETNMSFYSLQDNPVSTSGLSIGKTSNYKDCQLHEGDYLFLPGLHYETLMQLVKYEKEFLSWLQVMAGKGVNICSVCNAAFFLGEAGLLDGKNCTTHWRRSESLQKMYPNANVLNEVLFIRDGNVLTSAGISAGIDLALAILEELAGPFLVNKVARGMVIYHRRGQKHTQQSIYLDYRNHINPKVHQVQDYLVENLSRSVSIDKLAAMVCMSARNLGRIFKESTGITVLEYLTKLRLEKAKTIRNNPNITVKDIASQCGFASPRQLQRIIRKHSSP